MQHAAALAPVIAGLQEEVTALKRDLDQQRLQAAVAQQELEGMNSRLNEVRRCDCSWLPTFWKAVARQAVMLLEAPAGSAEGHMRPAMLLTNAK